MEHQTSKHILIVEDSLDLQTLLANLFALEGYKIGRADNGREALDLLHSSATLPSVILLDIMMPVMNGIEFRKEQMKDSRLAEIPVVVITADSTYYPDSTEVVRKPITDLDGLLKTVERVQH